jgi:hypothetical protein
MLVLKHVDCDNVSQTPSKGYANWMCEYNSNSNFATCRIGKVYFFSECVFTLCSLELDYTCNLM